MNQDSQTRHPASDFWWNAKNW